MKLTIQLTLGLLFTSTVLFGQIGDFSGNANAINIRLSSAGVSDYKEIEGTPYLNKEFKPAKIGKEDKSYLVRYNAYNEKIQVKVNEKKIMNLNSDKKYVVKLKEGETYMPVEYEDGKEGFGVLLWNNSKGFRLIKRQVIELEPPTETNGYMKAQPAKFSKVRIFYYVVENGKLNKVPGSAGKIYKEIFDNSLKATAKKEKLNPKKEEDLIKLCDIYFK